MRRAFRRTNSVLIVFLWGSAGGAAAHAQQKLEDIVRRSPEGIEFTLHRQVPPASLADLVTKADLVVRGLVLEGRSHLTADEREIETDHTVQVLEVLGGSRRVDPGQKVVVTKPGGTMNLAGRTVVMSETQFPPLEDGREYVLFLRPDSERNVSIVVGGSQGAFVIENGFADQVNGEIQGLRGKLPLAVLKDEVRQLVIAK